MEIVSVGEFVFDKDGASVPYNQIVVRTARGYQVKKATKDLRELIEGVGTLPMVIDTLLYDKYGRVADIK